MDFERFKMEMGDGTGMVPNDVYTSSFIIPNGLVTEVEP